MVKRNPGRMEYVTGRAEPYMPRELEERAQALPPSIQLLVDLVDMTDPAWSYIVTCLREFAEADIEIDADTVMMAIKLGRSRCPAAKANDSSAGWGQVTLASVADSIVYYALRGTLIKIGTTADPPERFRDLLPDEILAYEPGGRPEEAARHEQFKHLCHTGEYFRDAVELRLHIEHLRSLYGEPDPAWRTVASGRAGIPRPLPPPESREVLTAVEAEVELGVNRQLVRRWARKGWLQPVGYRERSSRRGPRARVFYRDHIRALHKRLRYS